jgi:hypothetical protein
LLLGKKSLDFSLIRKHFTGLTISGDNKRCIAVVGVSIADISDLVVNNGRPNHLSIQDFGETWGWRYGLVGQLLAEKVAVR